MNNYEENDLVFDILELCLYSCVFDYIHNKKFLIGMKRKRPYSNTQPPHGTQHSPHLGGQFVPRNMPGPSSSP